jgi:GT2 family glycosyltransferase
VEESDVDRVDVSVIICTRNRAGRLARALDAIIRQQMPDARTWETLVVDNDSADGTREVVGRAAASAPVPVRYLSEARTGKSFALTTAIAASTGEILVFTDDDVEPPTGWLASLVTALDQHPECIGAGGAVKPVWDMPLPSWLDPRGPHRPKPLVVQFWQGRSDGVAQYAPVGPSCAYRRAAFERYGGYREDFEPLSGGRGHACEDTEFARRLVRNGEQLWYVASPVVEHPVDPDRLDKSYFVGWSVARGRTEALELSETLASDVPMLGGVPRFMWRSLATTHLRWWTALGASRRFFHRLRAAEIRGAIGEWRRRGLVAQGDAGSDNGSAWGEADYAAIAPNHRQVFRSPSSTVTEGR